MSRHTSYLAQMHADGQRVDQPEWLIEPGRIAYRAALSAMEAHVDGMSRGTAAERIWLVEHDPVITAGTSAIKTELVDRGRFPVVVAGRGGRHTYHGPGQRVVYPMLDLNMRGRDVHRLVAELESWAITALDDLGLRAFVSDAGTGIWVETVKGVAKIGAIGVRVRRWISFHGMAINVTTDLSHFGAIIPCGIASHGVTRIVDHVPGCSMADFDGALKRSLPSFLDGLDTNSRVDTKTLEARSNSG